MPIVFATLLSLLAALSTAPAQAEAGAATGSEAPLAYVTVAGAPGDGETALAEALSRQLAARGVGAATAFQANIYEVQGTVRLAPAEARRLDFSRSRGAFHHHRCKRGASRDQSGRS